MITLNLTALLKNITIYKYCFAIELIERFGKPLKLYLTLEMKMKPLTFL